MKFLQHYYTSSKVGQGEGSGFQTYSLSEGLTELENQELERNSMYIRPSNMIMDPTDEDLDKQFPKAFSFFPLSSGRYGISLAQYRGTDYSGRTGNFFTHTLICEHEDLQFHPIQLYRNSHFKNRLTVEEDSLQGKPAPLPALHLVDEKRFISRKRIESFLLEKDRTLVLKQMIQAVFESRQHGRRILILDEQENVPLWFAAISMTFPVKFAKELSFTTYTYDPLKSQALLNATLPDGTNYRNNETMIGHQFYVFDLFQQKFPRNAGEGMYAPFVSSIIPSNWDGLQTFLNFIEKTKLEKIDEQLDAMLLLYLFLDKKKLEHLQLKKALQFAQMCCGEGLKKEIVTTFWNNYRKDTESWQSLIIDIDIEIAETLSSLLFEVGYQSGEAEIVEYAFSFFLSSFNQLNVDAVDQQALQGTLAYFNKVKALDHPPEAFSKAVLGDHYLKDVHQILKSEPDEGKIHVYMVMILEQLQALGEPWEKVQKPKMYLVSLASMALQRYQKIVDVERLVKQYPEYLGKSLLVLHPKLEKQQTYIELVLFNSIQRGELLVQDILRLSNGPSVINKLFKQTILASNQPVDMFLQLHRKLFQAEEPTSKRLQLLINRILELKEKTEWMQQAKKLLASPFAVNVDKTSLEQLIKLVEEQLPLNEKYEQYSELVANIAAIKKKKDNLEPSILNELYTFGKKLPELQRIMSPSLEKIAAYLTKVTETQYQEYLLWVVPSFVKHKKVEKVIEYLVTPERLPALWLVFKQVEHSLKKEEKIEFLTCYLLFYLQSVGQQEGLLKQELISYCKENKALFKKMADDVNQSKDFENLTTGWKEIEGEVFKSESLLKKVLSPFIRKTRK